MTQEYAKDQPVGFRNSIDRIAMVGAGGQAGKFIAEFLVKTGKEITGITRKGSKNALPSGIKAVPVDYDDESTLVAALKGQQFLIITLAVTAPPDTESKLIAAAGKAGVRYIIPNCLGSSRTQDRKMAAEGLISTSVVERCAEVEAVGAAWITFTCGLWYEYSLVMGPTWFGIDLKAKKLTLYDEGETKVGVTTWEQCGRAMAALVCLKDLPEDESDGSTTLSGLKNKNLSILSFWVSQKGMFESWKRVTGQTDEEWTLEKEPARDRVARGKAMMQTSEDPLQKRMGLALASFARVFYPEDWTNEKEFREGNEVLGLPEEDLDDRTKVAKEMFDAGHEAWVLARMVNGQ